MLWKGVRGKSPPRELAMARAEAKAMREAERGGRVNVILTISRLTLRGKYTVVLLVAGSMVAELIPHGFGAAMVRCEWFARSRRPIWPANLWPNLGHDPRRKRGWLRGILAIVYNALHFERVPKLFIRLQQSPSSFIMSHVSALKHGDR